MRRITGKNMQKTHKKRNECWTWWRDELFAFLLLFSLDPTAPTAVAAATPASAATAASAAAAAAI